LQYDSNVRLSGPNVQAHPFFDPLKNLWPQIAISLHAPFASSLANSPQEKQQIVDEAEFSRLSTGASSRRRGSTQLRRLNSGISTSSSTSNHSNAFGFPSTASIHPMTSFLCEPDLSAVTEESRVSGHPSLNQVAGTDIPGSRFRDDTNDISVHSYQWTLEEMLTISVLKAMDSRESNRTYDVSPSEGAPQCYGRNRLRKAMKKMRRCWKQMF
jgi:hypothetical protein